MHRFTMAFLAAVALLAIGCVITTKHTIDAHITLDIRHIEKQADNVLDFIEGKTDALPAPAAEKPAGPTSLLYRALDAVSPIRTAYAADAQMKEDSADIRPYAEKMRERQPSIAKWKEKGVICEDNRGYLSLREGSVSDPKEKNEVQKLIAAENDDRKAMYRLIARESASEEVTLTSVENVYAQRRLERAKSGEIFQLPPDGPAFEKFKASETGKKLGDKCKPGAWVTIP